MGYAVCVADHEEPPLGIHWTGGCVDPRAGLNDLEERKFLTLPGLELRPLSRPGRSQSLYRLRYPGSSVTTKVYTINILWSLQEFQDKI
jgi:hypothetical protein